MKSCMHIICEAGCAARFFAGDVEMFALGLAEILIIALVLAAIIGIAVSMSGRGGDKEE